MQKVLLGIKNVIIDVMSIEYIERVDMIIRVHYPGQSYVTIYGVTDKDWEKIKRGLESILSISEA